LEWEKMGRPGDPLSDFGGSFESASCPTATQCVAVGAYGVPSRILFETLDARKWTIRASPRPHGEFTSVTCNSPSACYAVGTNVDSSLAERMKGTTWTVQSTSNRTGYNVLGAVSCAPGSTTACTAVGYTLLGGTYTLLAERLKGSKWIVQTTPG
jgi:hypothetical protein